MTTNALRYAVGCVLLCMAIALTDCGSDKRKSQVRQNLLLEKLIELPLSGRLSERGAEISGLCWVDDQLLLLPQYPARFTRNGSGAVFRLPEALIRDYLENHQPASLQAIPVALEDQSVVSHIPGFQGYESIVRIGSRIFLTIEARTSEKGMEAYLVWGTLSADWQKISLDSASCQALELPAQVHNMSYETMVVAGGKLLLIYELNGLNINSHPFALLIDPLTGKIQKLNFPRIEFRITDATAMDRDGNFWVLNYYWPGEYEKIKPGDDLISGGAREGFSFDKERPVERLVLLHFENNTLSLADRSFYLTADQNGEGRNWEGVVRFDHQGFIIVTDKHPRTILAFAAVDTATYNAVNASR